MKDSAEALSIFSYLFESKEAILSGLQVTFSQSGAGVLTLWRGVNYVCHSIIPGDRHNGMNIPTMNPVGSMRHCGRDGEMRNKMVELLFESSQEHNRLMSQVHNANNNSTEFDRETAHFHLTTKTDNPKPVTPMQFKCWLDQIVGFQNNHELRQMYNDDPMFHEKMTGVSRDCQNGTDYAREIIGEVNKEFIPSAEVNNLLEAYQEFYDKCHKHPNGYSEDRCNESHPNSDTMSMSIPAIMAIAQDSFSAFGQSVGLGFVGTILRRFSHLENTQIEGMVNDIHLWYLLSTMPCDNTNLLIIASAMAVRLGASCFAGNNSSTIAATNATVNAGRAVLNNVGGSGLANLAVGATTGVISYLTSLYGSELWRKTESATNRLTANDPSSSSTQQREFRK